MILLKRFEMSNVTFESRTFFVTLNKGEINLNLYVCSDYRKVNTCARCSPATINRKRNWRACAAAGSLGAVIIVNAKFTDNKGRYD